MKTESQPHKPVRLFLATAALLWATTSFIIAPAFKMTPEQTQIAAIAVAILGGLFATWMSKHMAPVAESD